MYPSRVAIVVLLVALSACPAGAEEVSFQAMTGTHTYVFDPARIGREALEPLLILAPDSPLSSDIISTSMAARCVDSDPGYLPCGSRDANDPNLAANARINCDRSRTLLERIEQMQVPAELAEVKRSYVLQAVFASWLCDRQAAFFRSGDASVLGMPLMHGDGVLLAGSACNDEITAVFEANDPEARFELATHDWHNCVVDRFHELGFAYPEGDWPIFLEHYGVEDSFEHEGGI